MDQFLDAIWALQHEDCLLHGFRPRADREGRKTIVVSQFFSGVWYSEGPGARYPDTNLLLEVINTGETPSIAVYNATRVEPDEADYYIYLCSLFLFKFEEKHHKSHRGFECIVRSIGSLKH